MKKPGECLDLQEIRKEIDQIDKNIIDLLGLRFNYVKAAAKFKKDEQGVIAPERFETMLAQRRLWAEENKLSADVIEKVYRDLVGYFIARELQLLRKKEHVVPGAILAMVQGNSKNAPKRKKKPVKKN